MGIYKVLRFPVELLGNYERYYFRFNICFVFDDSVDLSCYEPIIWKVNCVLTAYEVSSHISSFCRYIKVNKSKWVKQAQIGIYIILSNTK